jgi:hypothetical protein
MLHKELGAYLIAVGQRMIISNQSVADILSEIALDATITNSMAANGLDGQIAERIATVEGSKILRPLAEVRTFASVEECEQAKLADASRADNDEDDTPYMRHFCAMTREEIIETVDEAISAQFGRTNLLRLKHYSLTLLEIADHPNEVVEFYEWLDRDLALEADDVPDWAPFTYQQLLEYILANVQVAPSKE